METPEYTRFSAYVRRTTRAEAVPKRMQLFSWLNGPSHTSIAGLVNAVGGNSKDREWVSQAIRDKEIVILDDRRMGLPAPKDGQPAPECLASLQRVALALGVLTQFPEARAWATRLQELCFAIEMEMGEGHPFKEALRFAVHRKCEVGYECAADRPGLCIHTQGDHQ